MPFSRLALVIILVIAAAGATVLVAAALTPPAGPGPGAAAAVLPALLAVSLLWRVLARRPRRPEEDTRDPADR